MAAGSNATLVSNKQGLPRQGAIPRRWTDNPSNSSREVNGKLPSAVRVWYAEMSPIKKLSR